MTIIQIKKSYRDRLPAVHPDLQPSAGALDRILDLLQLPLAPDLLLVQAMAIALVVLQQLVYVLALHALAYWIFPRLQAPIPEPPHLLHGLVALDPL